MSNTKYLNNKNLMYVPDIISNPIKSIAEHPNYGADYMGNIYHVVNGHLKMLSPFSKGNYQAVKLDNETCSVGQIVATLYIPNGDPERYKVFHIDGSIINNAASNLAWCSPSEVNRLTWMDVSERKEYLAHRDQEEIAIEALTD